ncbi:3-oxo-5-alpha-steroid 4-dehydrogenase-domain-containing protein [Parasitella parasitica]|nr:3-oxo-5-alpha-steroid 4-dehydrogenase-domain-containing protein [Parasitella parasitica]
MYLIIFICTCLIILAILSICAQQLHELQASVLSYGKLNLHNNKKPTTNWAYRLSKLTVRKRCFSHFYVVGLTTAIISIAELTSLSCYKKPLFFMYLLDRYDNRAGSHHLPQQQCIIGLILVTCHLSRRVYESFCVEKPSKTATMHVSHYLIGIGFYGAMVLGTWLEGVSNFEPLQQQQQQQPLLNMINVMAIILFFYASYHQHKCHVILSSLRSNNQENYSIPRGDWFETLVTPHYFADILIYLALNILYRFRNYIILCGLIWTAVNLSIVSQETQTWYRTHFSTEKYYQAFPRGRKRIIPGLY